MTHKIVAIVGPTAVGKSSIALQVAEEVGAEIVSIDSMQVYRGMDIGTDKATPEMRARVRHHLIDLKDPRDEVTVAEYQDLARAAIDAICDRGKLPILVGGSGLYFRAVVDDLRFPPTKQEVRSRLEDEAGRIGPEALYERLRELDPKAAQRIEPANDRRVVRALEVIEITGRPFSDNDSWEKYESIYDLQAIGLRRDRAELDDRIERRVDKMLVDGLVQEALEVEARGMGRTARMALGYRQVLDAPDAAPEALRISIAKATKRFARRQESWFRADPRIHWADATSGNVVKDLVERLAAEKSV